MNFELLISGISNLFISLLCIGISIPLLCGKIKRNHWYGVRIPKAFVSEDNWNKINQYGAKAMIYWSIPVLVLGIAMTISAFFISKTEPSDLGWVIPLSLSGLLILGALIQTFIWSAKLPNKDENAEQGA